MRTDITDSLPEPEEIQVWAQEIKHEADSCESHFICRLKGYLVAYARRFSLLEQERSSYKSALLILQIHESANGHRNCPAGEFPFISGSDRECVCGHDERQRVINKALTIERPASQPRRLAEEDTRPLDRAQEDTRPLDTIKL